MAIRYDKNEGWTTWLDDFKTNAPEPSKETVDFLNSTRFKFSSPKADGYNFKKVFDDFNITDHREELEKFMKSWNGVGDATEAYRQHLIKADKTTSSFGKMAGGVFRSIGAGLASMGINMVIGMAIEGIVQLLNTAERRAEAEKKRAEEIYEHNKKMYEESSRLAEEARESSKQWVNLGQQMNSGQVQVDALADAFYRQADAMGMARGEVQQLIDEYGTLEQAIVGMALTTAEKTVEKSQNETDDAKRLAFSEIAKDENLFDGDVYADNTSWENIALSLGVGEIKHRTDLKLLFKASDDNIKSKIPGFGYYDGSLKLKPNEDITIDDLQKATSLVEKQLEEIENTKGYINDITYQRLVSLKKTWQTALNRYWKADDKKQEAQAEKRILEEIANGMKGGSDYTREEYDKLLNDIKGDKKKFKIENKVGDHGYDHALKFLQNYFPQYSGATESLFDHDSIEFLNEISSALKPVSGAMKELTEDGKLTTETIMGLKNAASLNGKEWENYKNILLGAKKGSAETNAVMSQLIYTILENKYGVDELANANAENLSIVLEELGFAGGVELSQHIIAKAKAENIIASKNLSDVLSAESGMFQELTEQCGLTAGAYVELLIQEIAFANNDLGIDGKIEKIRALATQLIAAGKGYQFLNEVADMPRYDKNATGTQLKDWANKVGFDVVVNKDKNNKPILVQNNKGDWVEDYIYVSRTDPNVRYTTIDDVAAHVALSKWTNDVPKIEYTGGTPKAEIGTQKDPDHKDITEATINRINLPSRESKVREENIQSEIEIAKIGKDYEKQISLTNDLIDTRKNRHRELNIANAELHQMAEDLRNSTPQWQEEEWFNSQGEATETYVNLYNSSSKEQQEALNTQFEKVSKVKKAWIENDKEITSLNKELLNNAETLNELYESIHDDRVKNIEHERDMALKANPFADVSEYNKKLQAEYHSEAERLRSLDAEKYKERIQELQKLWWDALDETSEWRYEVSQRWIEDRNTYGDWELFNDSEVEAWERVVKWLKSEYPNDLEKIREAEQSLFEARKQLIDDLSSEINDQLDTDYDIRISRLKSQSSLLSSHFGVVNAITEEQHKLNKELREAETIGARMSEQERETLFTKADHTRLSSKLSGIMDDITELQGDYLKDLATANENTIDEITNNYERQYELKMKEYEIVRAELDLQKAQQKLANVENEKSVRTWTGSGWSYEADIQDVLSAQEELENTRYELLQSQSQYEQETAINKIDAETDRLQTEKNTLISTLEDLSKALKGEGEDISYMLQTLAKTDLPTFESIVKAMGDSIKDIFGISDKDIKKYRKEGKIIKEMNENSQKWLATENQDERNRLHELNQIHADYLGLVFDDETGLWVKPKERYASGTRNAKPGLNLFDENGFGSEVIFTDNGILTQFNGGEHVFSPEMTERLWQMAQDSYQFNPIIQHDFGRIIPVEDKVSSMINSMSNISGDTYMIKDVQLSEGEGGILKGFINFLKTKV